MTNWYSMIVPPIDAEEKSGEGYRYFEWFDDLGRHHITGVIPSGKLGAWVSTVGHHLYFSADTIDAEINDV